MSEIPRKERCVTAGRVKGSRCLLGIPAEPAGWIAVLICPSLLCNSTVLPTPPEPLHTVPGETEEKCRMTALDVKSKGEERDRLVAASGLSDPIFSSNGQKRGFPILERFSRLVKSLSSKIDYL